MLEARLDGRLDAKSSVGGSLLRGDRANLTKV